MVAPTVAPSVIIDKLNVACRDALAQPQAREGLANLSASIEISTPAQLGKFLADELVLWSGVVKAADIRVK